MRKFHVGCFFLLAFVLMILPVGSSAQISVGVAIHIGPPALPVYEQPLCPAEGYIWTPGYWAYGPGGYYWVPGTWVMAPEPGLLWTPGYWGWGGGGYFWHVGYWGPHVGFYGGINYGFGYGGVGYVGGRWEGEHFRYNTAITHVNTTIVHTTYVDRTVVRNVTVNRVSFNGGTGGVRAVPSERERSYEHERHFQPTEVQTRHEHSAGTNRASFASENHGRPAVAATGRPGEFHGHDVVASREYSGNREAHSNASVHPSDRGDFRRDDRPAGHVGAGASNPQHVNASQAHVNEQHAEPKPHTEGRLHGGAPEHHEGGGKPHNR